MDIDPVCGMAVAPDAAKSLEHQGTRYYFCCAGCLAKFRADPQRYLAPAAAQPATAPSAAAAAAASPGHALYTCPMHPEVRHRGPGSCPICGMALEPLVASLVEEHGELDDMTRRFGIALILTLPVLLLGMGSMLPSANLQRWLPPATADWLQALLATPVVWGAG